MLKKICPICDREMRMPYYCRYCKSLVRKPEVRNITYYMNESRRSARVGNQRDDTMRQLMSKVNARPAERQPETPQQAERQQTARWQQDARRQQAAPRTAEQQQTAQWQQDAQRQQAAPRAAEQQQTARWEQAVRRQQAALRPAEGPQADSRLGERPQTASRPSSEAGRPSRSGLARFLPLLFVLLLFALNSGIFSRIRFGAGAKEVSVGGSEANSGYLDDYDNAEVLDNQTVIEAGTACDLAEHFHITGAQAEEAVRTVLAELDLVIEDEQADSFNLRYGNGETIFSTYYNFYLESADTVPDIWPYVTVDSDTATGGLHQVTGMLEGGDTTVKVVSALLESIETYEDVETPFAAAGVDEAAMLEGLESEDMYQAEHEGVYFWISPYQDDCYNFNIYR